MKKHCKNIAVLRGHLQPCCEALTLRHAWLNLISVQASKERERERERERGRKREEERGGRPTRADRGERKDLCKTCARPVHVPEVRRSPAGRADRRKEEAPKPAARKEEEEKKEGEKERKNQDPERETTPTKKPAAFSDQNQDKNTIPRQESLAPKNVPIYCRSSPHKTL